MAAKDFLTAMAHAIFGKPDGTKTGLFIRGAFITLALPLPPLIIDLIGQIVGQLEGAGIIEINIRILIRFYLVALLPALGTWVTVSKVWLAAEEKAIKARLQSRQTAQATDRLIEIAVQAPHQTTIDDVKAIYVHEVNQQQLETQDDIQIQR